MLKDALLTLQGWIAQATEPRKIESGDPHKLAYVVNGSVLEIETKPEPRRHIARCLDDLVKLALRFADSDCGPVVWYDESGATLVIDDCEHRLETVRVDFELSDVFKVLKGLRESKAWFEQKPFIRLLRIDLAGTLEPFVLLDKVRRLRFENGAVTTGVVQRNQESLGREITAKVDATGDIPEDVILCAPVFKTLGLTCKREIRCSVEVDPSLGRLQLMPIPDEIERVMLLSMESIGGWLAEQLKHDGPSGDVPAYYGRPE